MNCQNHPERERVSFCQNCGKALCLECSRAVGSGVFCEPCLAARLAGGGASHTSSIPFTPVPGADFGPLPPSAPGLPSPPLAAVLGLIPGVGAMYNGQYPKGVVHLIVFAILVSLSNQNGVFGLFIAGWIFYMAFEAYHTANARRFGTPLPNPFGLNDIGERFGFGRAWPTPAATPYSAPVTSSFTSPPPATPFYPDTATRSDSARFTDTANAPQPFQTPASSTTQVWESFASSIPPMPPVPPFSAVHDPVRPLDTASRFPMGAVILIGLGLLFFFGSSGVFWHFPIQHLLPFFLMGLGVWLFIRKMTAHGLSFADDGSAAYRLRAFQALRGSVWVILVGFLFLLDNLSILSWGRSWPLYIILAGVMALLQRYAYATAPAPTYPPAYTTEAHVPPVSETSFRDGGR